MGGGFKAIQHKSSITDEAEFGDDYADEEILANNRLSYLGLLDGLHIQQAGTDYGQDYEAGDDYADDESPPHPERSFMGILGK